MSKKRGVPNQLRDNFYILQTVVSLLYPVSFVLLNGVNSKERNKMRNIKLKIEVAVVDLLKDCFDFRPAAVVVENWQTS